MILLTQLPTPNIYRDVAEEVNRLAEDHLVVVPAGDTGADVCGDMALVRIYTIKPRFTVLLGGKQNAR